MQCADLAAYLKWKNSCLGLFGIASPMPRALWEYAARGTQALRRWQFDRETCYDATRLSRPLCDKTARSRGPGRSKSDRKPGATAGPRHNVVGRKGRTKSREPSKRPFALQRYLRKSRPTRPALPCTSVRRAPAPLVERTSFLAQQRAEMKTKQGESVITSQDDATETRDSRLGLKLMMIHAALLRQQDAESVEKGKRKSDCRSLGRNRQQQKKAHLRAWA